MKIYLETYGCQMNEYDSEIVKAVLQNANYSVTQSLSEADVVLLNTCSVRDHATRRIYGRVHEIQYQRNGDRALIGILGCMATHFREALLQNTHLPIDFIVGPDSYKRLPQLIEKAAAGSNKLFDLTLSEFETYADIYPAHKTGVNAWIAVMRGCNNFCSFCVVPYTRGRERSRSPENILTEVRQLAEEGFQQVTLLGQNVNSYRFAGNDFADLLEMVSEVNGIKRIRFISPHPKDFPHRLLHVVAENPVVCKHIHLPVQTGNNHILNLMNRTYTQEDYLQLVEEIRHRCAEIVLTTDIIVGFPTETDEEFADTLRLMEQIKFDSAFIFKYSERPQTIAQRKYPDEVPEEVKTARIVKLNVLQKQHSLASNLAHIGQIHEVLIEEESTKKSATDCQGRNDGNKLVILPKGNYHRGQFVHVRISDATTSVLKGEVIEVVEK